MRNSLTSTPIKLSCAGLALCHTIEKTWILVKTGLLFPVFATLTRNDPWARITGQNSLYIFATYLMHSPCRRSERAVVADAAVVLLHAVVVVRSIVRNLDTSVLIELWMPFTSFPAKVALFFTALALHTSSTPLYPQPRPQLKTQLN